MIKRQETAYNNESERFVVKNIDYMKQYSHVYIYRLTQMYSLLKKRAEQHWGSQYPVCKLSKLDEQVLNRDESLVLIGTLFKHQVHKPSILREVSEENQLAPQPPREHYADVADQLLLEDEMQRVRLAGKVDTDRLATGVVCAVLGSLEQSGRFAVEEILYYESGPQQLLKAPITGSRGLLVLLSGLNQLQPTAAEELTDALNLLQHWLSGNLGPQPKQLSRLIIAGNLLQQQPLKKAATLQWDHAQADEYGDMVAAVGRLDGWFAAWARSIALDVMPGPYDPVNFMLPQQPFHPLMFTAAGQRKHFQSVPNPYACTLDGVLVVGCAGQNVRDILRSTMIEEELEALRSTLVWSHIAPTAPDTLACFPHLDNDPLILRECPHVYFAGNCRKFETELHLGSDEKRTRLVCVPSFSETRSVAVVDLDTLDCHQVSFATKSIE